MLAGIYVTLSKSIITTSRLMSCFIALINDPRCHQLDNVNLISDKAATSVLTNRNHFMTSRHNDLTSQSK